MLKDSVQEARVVEFKEGFGSRDRYNRPAGRGRKRESLTMDFVA